MKFQLVIKNLIRAQGNVFGNADVRNLENSATVGTKHDCEVRIDDKELKNDVHFFSIAFVEANPATLEPLDQTKVFVNDQPVQEPTTLLSGDEIRVGHWTFRFQKNRRKAGVARRADALATLAKLLLATILVTEVLMATWLPKKLEAEKIATAEILQQQTVMLLDELRSQLRRKINKTADQSGEPQNRNHAAMKLVAAELDTIAEYIRNNNGKLKQEQWPPLYAQLQRFQTLINRIDNDSVFKPLPKLMLNQTIKEQLATARPIKHEPDKKPGS